MRQPKLLTPRQTRFVQEYVVDGNGKQAAIRAGFAASGAHTEASRLLRNAEVAAAIKSRQEVVSARLAITQEQVVAMLIDAYKLAKEQSVPATMMATAREIGRLMGFYPSTQTRALVTARPEDGHIDFSSLSDRELFQTIANLTTNQPSFRAKSCALGW